MTTHSRPSSTAASTDPRTTYRRVVLAAVRGASIEEVAELAATGIGSWSGWPVTRLSKVDATTGVALSTLATCEAVARRDLVDLLATSVAPDLIDPLISAITTGRPAWSEPGPEPTRLTVPISHGGSILGVIELIDDQPRDIDDDLLTALGDLAEVIGASMARIQRERAQAIAAPPVEDDAARAVRERMEIDQQRLREAEVIGAFGVWELLPGQEFAWSAELCRIHGVPPDFIPTLDANLALVHPDDLALIDDYMSRMRADRESPPVQYRIRRPGGEIRWVESHVKVLAGDRVIGITRDITEQRAREQRERLQAQIAQTMHEGVSLVRADGTILYVNPQFAAMFDYTPEEMEGRCIWDFNTPELRHPPGTVTEPRPGSFQGELRHVRRDGSVFVTQANLTAMPVDLGVPGELAWLAVERDITEEKARSEALRDREERLALIQRHAPNGLALVDLDGRFLEVNPALCTITAREAAELHARTLVDLTHPDDVGSFARDLARLVSGEIEHLDTEQRYRLPDGTAVWVALKLASARDEAGAVRYLIAQIVDIGDSKQAEQTRRRHAEELERSNAELRAATEEAERANRAKNEFLSRMSHELRTPLNAVLGFAQLLGMEELSESHLDMVDQVLRGGRHLLILVDEVLDIARMENGTMTMAIEPLDIAAVLDHARSLLDPLVREREVTVRLPGRDSTTDLPAVAADRQRVVQILLNLLSNGIKYNQVGGEVSVTATAHQDHVAISVTDTGPGIAPEVLPRVFEPFDRLGAEQSGIEGTGIGLTVSRALAEQMGGRLSVRSQLGVGSTFTLDLPAADLR
jgi:PAS domain S-box-containing protein